MLNRALDILLWLFALAAVVTGLHMIAGPLDWYQRTPSVPDTGPANVHFIRDIGVAYLVGAVALVWALRSVALRRPLLILALVWFGGHAGLHVAEWIGGHHGHDGFWLEVVGVLVPALVMLAAIARPPSAQA